MMFPVPVQPRPRSRIPELDEPRSSHNAVRTLGLWVAIVLSAVPVSWRSKSRQDNTVRLLGSLCSRSQRNCAPGHRRLLPPQSRAITFLCSAVHILLATRVPLPKSCSGQRPQRPTVGLLLLAPTRTDFGASHRAPTTMFCACRRGVLSAELLERFVGMLGFDC